MKDNKWLRLLTYVTGLVNQELLLQNEYLAAENRILRAHLPARLRLSDPERSTLAEIGKRLGRKALAQVACVAKPDTILAWYRRLIASKFDGSKHRSYPGRPRIDREIEALIVRMARENSGWGYDRIVGALSNLGHHVTDQTVGNVLRRHGIDPAPKRSQNTTWKEFIASHMAVLAGIDFFTVEVLTWRGLVTYYVLFFIHLESRRISVAGITRHPDEAWMQQMARNATDENWGYIAQRRYALHDRDTKFCASFRTTLAAGGIRPIQLPARSPNLNAFAERWVRSVKQECLSKLILFGEASLRRALAEFVEHFHTERNHQGKGNVLLFPSNKARDRSAPKISIVPRTAWWFAQILLPCRMNILAIRGGWKMMSSAVVPRAAEIDTFSERHFTIADLAKMWTLSYEAVRRLFDREPGVFRMKSRGRIGRREYATVRIPESVARRVRQRQLNP